uniref:Uncharacterized protein n=1 Tax=Arundo donax TaxID=35708 RepID=A0A0A9CVP9_ARUDO
MGSVHQSSKQRRPPCGFPSLSLFSPPPIGLILVLLIFCPIFKVLMMLFDGIGSQSF